MRSGEVYWYGAAGEPDHAPAISANASCDVVVVGGGMAGLTCAGELNDKGYRVILLERDFCGAGASGKSSGFITPDSELELSSLVEVYGTEVAHELWEFVTGGVRLIRDHIESFFINCDYQPQDSLFVASKSSDREDVRAEYDARKKFGYDSTIYSEKELPAVLGARGYTNGVRYTQTFGMNSYAYCQGMKKVLERAGVTIYEDSPVTEVLADGVRAKGQHVSARFVVLCMDRFTPELGLLQNEVYHIETFLAATAPLTDDEVRTVFPKERMMVWDSDLVYQYFRITGENRLLIGGSDISYTYRTKEQKRLRHITKEISSYAKNKFPFVKKDIEYLWPGMLGVTRDLLPITGEDPARPNVFYIAAATGLPWAAALGRHIAERISGVGSNIDKFFRADRKFILHPRLERLLGTKATYALSHGVAKYRNEYPELLLKVGREIKKALA